MKHILSLLSETTLMNLMINESLNVKDILYSRWLVNKSVPEVMNDFSNIQHLIIKDCDVGNKIHVSFYALSDLKASAVTFERCNFFYTSFYFKSEVQNICFDACDIHPFVRTISASRLKQVVFKNMIIKDLSFLTHLGWTHDNEFKILFKNCTINFNISWKESANITVHNCRRL